VQAVALTLTLSHREREDFPSLRTQGQCEVFSLSHREREDFPSLRAKGQREVFSLSPGERGGVRGSGRT
jgi:hypothetical protein